MLILTLASPVSQWLETGAPSEGTVFSMPWMMKCASPASDASDRGGPSVGSKSDRYVNKTESLAFCFRKWDKHGQVRRTVLVSSDMSSGPVSATICSGLVGTRST